MNGISLADRVAVVTGGAGGIGAAVVAGLTEGGAIVEVADLDAEPCVDVTDAAAVDAFARGVLGRHGRCDILINCVGALAAGNAVQVTEQEWDKAFATNVRAPWLVARAFIPAMPPGSAIVNVGSGAGLRAIPDMVAYVASKTALVGLSRAMAIDHAEDGIRVNCVCPGLVDTPMNAQAQRDRPAATRDAVAGFAGYLVPRYGTAKEIADAVIFLAAPTAGYISGSTLAVDGGRTMH